MQQPVLNYHAIGDHNSDAFAEWAIERQAFGRQLDYLVELGLTGVTMSQALRDPQPNQIALTFDDGYEDFVSAAVPELQARGFAATVFVATAHIGSSARWLDAVGAGDRPMATWEQLRRVDAAGFEIGSHSHSHPQLDLVSKDELRNEVITSKRVIENELGHPVPGFCYPHGFHGARVRAAVIAAGFEYACGVKHKMGTTEQDQFSIARIVVRRGDDVEQIGRWIQGQELRPGGFAVETTLAWAFRQYRRLRP